jgi:hypothetical protein
MASCVLALVGACDASDPDPRGEVDVLAPVRAGLPSCDTVAAAPSLDAELPLTDLTDARQRYRLTARAAAQPPDSNLVEFTVVFLVLYDSTGVEVAALTADRAEYDTACDAITARVSVVIESADGTRTLRTEELRYLPAEDRISSPVRSVYRRPGLEIEADSFRSDGRFENVTTWGSRARFDAPR